MYPSQYKLLNKDHVIATFSLRTSIVPGFEDLGNGIYVSDHLDVYDKMLYETVVGAQPLDDFLDSRKAPKHREHIRKLFSYLNLDNMLNFLNITYGLSLTDTLWVKPADLSVGWAQVNLFDNDFSKVVAHYAFTGTGLYGAQLDKTSPEFTTDGALPKCWIRDRNGEVKLMKGSTEYLHYHNSGFEPYAEFYAYQIAKQMNFYPYVEYDLIQSHSVISSLCPLFTSKSAAYISMARELAISGKRGLDFLRIIAEKKLGESYRDLVFFDCVICNTDRHLGNFGFLRDTDTYQVMGLSPIFDNGMGLGSLWMPDNDKSIVKYVAEDSPAHMPNDTFVTAGRRFLNEKRRAALEKLRGWTVPKHPLYNWPDLKYEAMNELLQHQVRQILA